MLTTLYPSVYAKALHHIGYLHHLHVARQITTILKKYIKILITSTMCRNVKLYKGWKSRSTNLGLYTTSLHIQVFICNAQFGQTSCRENMIYDLRHKIFINFILKLRNNEHHIYFEGIREHTSHMKSSLFGRNKSNTLMKSTSLFLLSKLG